jgi:SAM-dependent methyltransferase
VRLDSFFYRLAYRSGKPAWDSGEPHPELSQIIDGRQPGRALDLGCGTGANAVYLSRHGWEVVGVDFVSGAIETATSRASSTGSSVRFICADVTELGKAEVGGPFDLIIDVGCYHGVPAELRDAYVSEVAAVARPGADLYLAGISRPPAIWRLMRAEGVNADELSRRFSGAFELTDHHPVRAIGRASNFVLYHLFRTHAIAA